MKENNPFMPEENHFQSKEAREDSWWKEQEQECENSFRPLHSYAENNLGATPDDSWCR